MEMSEIFRIRLENLMKVNALLTGLALCGAVSLAHAEVTANMSATSNYVWRGVTQSNSGAAVQGGVDYALDSGFYLGAWASNISNGEEVDLYGGYAGEIGDFGYDLGVIYYAYPSANPDADFTELYGSVSYEMFSAGISYTVAADTDDTEVANQTFIEGDLHYSVSASFELSDEWSMGGMVGYYDFADDGVAGTDTSYNHMQLDVTKSAGDFGDVTFSISKAGQESGDEDPIVFITWGKHF